MDPASYCVYNVTRNALLSERVISVSEPQTPSQLLALVMNGPARDPHFCIRLTDVSVVADIPRLFAFDVAYLDTEQRILEIADVGPGTPFPALNEKVATILFLSDQLLPRSSTEVGDYIRICTEAELAALLRAAAQFQAVESPGWPIESSAPSNAIPPDPFAGSLIYLPSSGTPQNTEVFLASHATPPQAVDRPAYDSAPEPQIETVETPLPEMAASEPGVLNELSFEELELSSNELPSNTLDDTASQEPETQEPEQSAPVSPQPSLSLETPFHLTTELGRVPDKPQPEPAQRPSQLPFSLRAVIQFVDDQLRRENLQQQARPQDAPEKKIESFDTPLVETPVPAEVEEPQVELNQPVIASPGAEDVAEAPSILNEPIPEFPRIGARAAEQAQPQLDEVLSPAEFAQEEPPHLPPPTVPPQPQPSILLEHAHPPEPLAEAAPQPLTSPVVEPQPVQVEESSAAHPPAVTPPAPAPISEPIRPIRTSAKEKLPFATRVQRWLAGDSISLSGNRRRGERKELPGLVAFYFTGGAPKPHEILNISTSGLYIRSKELWSPNTLVRMTLERQDDELGEKKSISVLARVVRIDDGGIGHEFVTTEVLARLHARDFLPTQGTNRKELERFLAPPK